MLDKPIEDALITPEMGRDDVGVEQEALSAGSAFLLAIAPDLVEEFVESPGVCPGTKRSS
jgi:hypothetical protein